LRSLSSQVFHARFNKNHWSKKPAAREQQYLRAVRVGELFAFYFSGSEGGKISLERAGIVRRRAAGWSAALARNKQVHSAANAVAGEQTVPRVSYPRLVYFVTVSMGKIAADLQLITFHPLSLSLESRSRRSLHAFVFAQTHSLTHSLRVQK